jgi:hypothetical protein
MPVFARTGVDMQLGGKAKQPYAIAMKDGSPFGALPAIYALNKSFHLIPRKYARKS